MRALRVSDVRFDLLPRIAGRIAGVDRKCAALAGESGGIAEQARNPGAVEGRGHDEQLEIGPQALLRIAGEREAEIRVERAFVEFIESTATTPSSEGSPRIMLVKIPSVTTSMRVLRETLEPKRTR